MVRWAKDRLRTGALRFVAVARREGTARKGGLRVVIPAADARAMRRLGWSGWVRVTLSAPGSSPFFAVVRQVTASSGHVVASVALPVHSRGAVAAGDELDVSLEEGEPLRTAPGPLWGPAGLDWAAVVPDDVFATQDGDQLVIHSRYERPFRLKRHTAVDRTFWLLGFYQAEGNKGGTAQAWTVANRNPDLLRAVVELLAGWGLGAERLKAEVVAGFEQPLDVARAIFEPVGVDITTVRAQKGKRHNESASLYVRSSKPFLQMTRAVLGELVDDDLLGRLPAEAARDFALGFLDGDGTITLQRSAVALRAGGSEREQRAVVAALRRGFGWDIGGSFSPNASVGYLTTLDAPKALDLAFAGAFRYSMSRARLLYGTEERTAGLRDLYDRFGDAEFGMAEALRAGVRCGHISACRRWAYVEGEPERLRFTQRGIDVAVRFAKLAEELQALRKRVPEATGGRTWRKGVPLPPVDDLA